MPSRTRPLAALALLAAAALAVAQEPPTLLTARGVVARVDKETLTVRPRDAAGKFQPELRLKLTGTSRVTTLSPQTRGKKAVFTQKDTDPGALQPNQPVAVIYATSGADSVLLTAVVSPGK